MFWPTVHLNKAKLTSGHWLFQVYGFEKRPLSPFTASAFTQKTSHTVKTFDLIAAANSRLNVRPMCKLRSLWIWRKPEAMIQNNVNFQLELTQGCGLLSCEVCFFKPFFFFFSLFFFATGFIILQKPGLSALQGSIYHCWLSATSPHGRSNWIVLSAHCQDSRETQSCRLGNWGSRG